MPHAPCPIPELRSAQTHYQNRMNLEIQNLTGGYLDYLLTQQIEIIPDIVDLLH
jgi:hypothetical protein